MVIFKLMIVFKCMLSEECTVGIQGATMLCHNCFSFSVVQPWHIMQKATTSEGHRFHWLVSSDDLSLKPPKILIQ